MNIDTLKQELLKDIAQIAHLDDIKKIHELYLGKEGKLKAILVSLKDASIEEKKTLWLAANELKELCSSSLAQKQAELEEQALEEQLKKEGLDISLSYPSKLRGHKHPISQVTEILEDIFISLGFTIEDGPQIENETYNFDKLNIPDDHPARDVWDTFWLSDEINTKKERGEKLLLRTHTSPVQVRTMLSQELPIKIIVPGRVFRYEQEDARHTANFYQLEWLVVGEGVTFGDLKWTLDTVMKKLLWEKTELRFRPSIFPFTEPSAEVDVSCQICGGTGISSSKSSSHTEGSKKCSMCSGSGWVELLGSGMVHPKVLEACGIDSSKYSGFAFGMGIDRIAAQRFWVSSSRMFYQSKLKLNEQF